MSSSTIRSSARLGRGVLSLAVALCLTATCHAQQQIDNSTVVIINSFPAFPGYEEPFAIDIDPDQFITDYASQGGGTATFLDFDFGQAYTFTQIIETDRTTSGGPNHVFFGGTFDFNTSYMFIFSNDPSFATEEGRVTVTRDTPDQPTSIESFQTASDIPNLTAQFVRWQVLATNGVNPGAADFAFFGTPAP